MKCLWSDIIKNVLHLFLCFALWELSQNTIWTLFSTFRFYLKKSNTKSLINISTLFPKCKSNKKKIFLLSVISPALILFRTMLSSLLRERCWTKELLNYTSVQYLHYKVFFLNAAEQVCIPTVNKRAQSVWRGGGQVTHLDLCCQSHAVSVRYLPPWNLHDSNCPAHTTLRVPPGLLAAYLSLFLNIILILSYLFELSLSVNIGLKIM